MSTKEFAGLVGTNVPSHNQSGGLMDARAEVATSSPPIADHPYFAADLAQRWGNGGDVYFAAPDTVATIPPGVYRTDESSRFGPMLAAFKVDTDSLIVMPDDASVEIVAEVETFWKSEAAYRQYGFLHKRGLLLWGPPGSGKTSLLAVLMNKLIAAGGAVVFVDRPDLAAQCLKMARKIEPKRRLIAVYEDIDALVQRFGEAGYLALLDGEHQIDNVISIATTNYPERLDRRFADRPSRFDTVKKIGMPSADARRAYFMHAAPDMAGADLDGYVSKSHGFSIAHLKEMIIATKVLGQDLDDVIERMETMRDRSADSTREGKGNVGFASFNGAHP